MLHTSSCSTTVISTQICRVLLSAFSIWETQICVRRDKQRAAWDINHQLVCVGAYCEVVDAFRQSFYLQNGTLCIPHLQHTHTHTPLNVTITDMLCVFSRTVMNLLILRDSSMNVMSYFADQMCDVCTCSCILNQTCTSMSPLTGLPWWSEANLDWIGLVGRGWSWRHKQPWQPPWWWGWWWWKQVSGWCGLLRHAAVQGSTKQRSLLPSCPHGSLLILFFK